MPLSNSILIKRALTTSLLGMGLLISPVNAQEEAIEPLNIVSELVEPRFSGTFQTGSGVGYDSSFGSLHGFVPFAQTAGVSTFYGEGRFSAFTEGGGQSGNLRTGYRRFLPKSNLVLGGYTGWDVRQTGANKTFQQFGLGAEVLADKWEARINGYIPLGNSTQEVASSSIDTGFVVSDLRFVGNRLLYSGQREQSTTNLLEDALGGFDIEGGYQLSKWDTGNLYAYLGLYFLDGQESDSDTIIGVRGRLRAETDTLLAGMSVQSDGEFGANIQFSFGFKFGGAGFRKREETAEESLLVRLGQSVQRQDIIAINRTRKTETTISEQATDEVARNPETGEEWQFIHVKDGENNSGGTFEDPYGEVTNATAEIGTTGTVNDIVYVDSGDHSGMSGFTIPDNIKALSTGVTQEIEIVGIGTTQLPGSDTGTLPLIESTVTMGNNTTLSGFEIQTSNGNGVSANNVSDFNIDKNTITTAANSAYGILVGSTNSTVSGALISENTISTAGEKANGIFVGGYNATISDTSISRNTISTAGEEANGILVGGLNLTISDASISGNTISTIENKANGIYVGGNNARISNASISGNTISTTENDANGIYVRGNNSTEIIDALISGNTISTADDNANGIYVRGSNLATVSAASISGNIISTAGSDANGILVRGLNGAIVSNTSISENTISTTGSDANGILVNGFNATVSGASISSNAVTTGGANANGIFVRGVNGAIVSDASVSENNISTTGSDANGILVNGFNATVSGASISSNAVTTGGANANGIFVRGVNGATVRGTSISENTISTTGSDANGILVNGFTGAAVATATTVRGTSISENTVTTAETSFSVSSNNSDICVAGFTGNGSGNPNVDLNLRAFNGGAIAFVDFANVMVNNTGFDNISGAPSSQPTVCP